MEDCFALSLAPVTPVLFENGSLLNAARHVTLLEAPTSVKDGENVQLICSTPTKYYFTIIALPLKLSGNCFRFRSVNKYFCYINSCEQTNACFFAFSANRTIFSGEI